MDDFEAEVLAQLRAIRELLTPRIRAKQPLYDDMEPVGYSPAFLAFWDAYACPRRRNKPAAWREWRRLKLESMPREVLDALDAYKASQKWTEGYMPEPARWLKSEPWLDEPTLPPAEAHPVDPWEVKR